LGSSSTTRTRWGRVAFIGSVSARGIGGTFEFPESFLRLRILPGSHRR